MRRLFSVENSINFGRVNRVNIMMLAFFSVLLLLSKLAVADSRADAFIEAVVAVEERDYQALEKILDNNPDLIDYEGVSGCSLFCEYTRLLRAPTQDEVTPEIDPIAIKMLLKRGGKPEMSPHALGALLVAANVFNGDKSDFPSASGICTANRDSLFPVANKMIEAGSPLQTEQKSSSATKFTIGFFYTYQLCHVPYACGADYEKVSPSIANKIDKSITSTERSLLLELTETGGLSRICVSKIIEISEDL